MSNIVTDNQYYTNIANAIRAKNGTSNTYTPANISAAIADLPTPKDTIVFNQMHPQVAAYMAAASYDPSDYTTSVISTYAPPEWGQLNRLPNALNLTTGAGTLIIIDEYSHKAIITEVSAGINSFYNLIPSYSDYILIANGKIVESGRINTVGQVRMIKCNSNQNVRDIGGWACDGGTVKYGKLFRGSALNATDADILVNQCGVRSELDLRGTEVSQTESIVDTRLDYYRNDDYVWYSLYNGNTAKRSTWQQVLDYIFKTIAKDKPIYYHCTVGSDRTGTVSLVLEALLGVSQSDIDKDYELSTMYTGTHSDDTSRRRNEADWTDYIAQVTALTGDTFRDKVVNWVCGLGFTVAEINAFRANMIDGNPQELVL